MAIVSGEDIGGVTKPFPEPFPDIIQDLWQLNHLTVTYVARAGAGATLLFNSIHWVKPVVICEVTFTEWTGDDCIRHPSFQGLREDKKGLPR
jgi:ATP-dependent DNA ligase